MIIASYSCIQFYDKKLQILLNISYTLYVIHLLLCRVCQDVLQGVTAKCFNSSKQKTKEKAMEVFMLYIEAEKQDIVQVRITISNRFY